jgi:hypothetical protein
LSLRRVKILLCNFQRETLRHFRILSNYGDFEGGEKDERAWLDEGATALERMKTPNSQ